MEGVRTQNHYFAGLNGFRGLAALSILFFHSRLPVFKSLWIGVPMFFVLSGFLITRILISARSEQHYFKRFYYRRALRIFPIYYITLLVSIAWCYLTKGDFKLLPYFVFYLQSFPISLSMEPLYCYGHMNHTWSLSVEELFYFVWPLIIWFTNRSWLKAWCLALGLLSIAFKLLPILFFYSGNTDPLVFASLPGSLDALMVGTFLGLLSVDEGNRLPEMFPKWMFYLSGSVLLVVLAFYYQSHPEPRVFSVLKLLLQETTLLLSASVITRLVSPSGRLLKSIFENRFIQWTGTVSYGLYLYHFLVYIVVWALLEKSNIQWSPWIVLPLQMLTTFLIALLSWRFIERPFLSLKEKRFARAEVSSSD